MTYHYSSPPKGYTPYETSPYSSGETFVYYAPQYQYETTPIKKQHSRKVSYTATTKPGGWHSPTGYPKYYENTPNYQSPPQRKDVYYVSEKKMPSKTRSYSMNGKRPAPTTTTSPPRKQTQPIRVHDGSGEADYVYYEPTPKSRHMKADSYFYFSQDQVYDEQPKRSRARRPSTTTKSPQKPAKTVPKKPAKATEKDIEFWNIPPGYCTKNWDPKELPIILLGSVFDANSLGKWIYDWTVAHHGASTPMADVAGDLWLLLIKLAGKMSRAEERVKFVEDVEDRQMVLDFLESGDRLWQKMKDLLKECEQYMWRAAKREGAKGSVQMGRSAGTEFIDSIFGRDRQLENTEKLMNSVRLWNMRFDANLEEILRR